MRFPLYLGLFLLINILIFSKDISENTPSIFQSSTNIILPLIISAQELEFDSLSIPLKRAGKLLMIETKIDGQTGNLVFDTGASGLVLNSTYFRDYNRFETTQPNSITGSVGKTYRTTVDSLEINGILYRNKTADLAELGHIENRRGIKVLGLFGFELIRKYEIIIDIRNNEIKLLRTDKNGNRINGIAHSFQSDFTQKIVEKNNILFLVGEVGGKSLKFCLDTGAEINAISSNLQKGVLSTITINRRSRLAGANSATTEVFYGSMNDFSFGSKKLDNMQTVVTNLSSLMEAYDMQFSGVLGFDFIEKGVICINMKKNQLGIHYNTAD